MRVRSLISLSGSGIWCCYELWCRSQTWLRSGVAVAVAGSCCSDWPRSLGTSICCECGPKKAINQSFNQSINYMGLRVPKRGGHSMPLGQGHTGKHLGQSGGRREGRTWTRAFILVFVGRNKRLCGRLTNLTNLTNLNNFS